jgi:tyrosyl-tRNA synthetase
MISMDSVKSRLEREQSMNFVEFNYMLIQGYDFAHLYENHNCLLQIGGSDQWGNITEGLELISRMKGGNAFALTAPLITRSDGKKMGKSENGAIYLSGKMLSPYEYFQYFRNIPDADIPKMLNFYTELPQEKITFLSNMKGKEINEAKEVLAFEATKICHGETLALEALKQSKTVFDEKLSPDIQELTFQDVLGSKLLSILQKNGAIESLAEGKTLIKQGAVKLNDVTVDNFSFTFEGIGSYKLSLGKKKRYTIIIK